MSTNIENVSIRLARSPEEIDAAQHLRYRVFYEEYGAKATHEMARIRRDIDDYDAISDHLVVIDSSHGTGNDQIVGTYRLLQRAPAEKYGQFYSASEYHLGPLLNCGLTLLELGRSCVLPEYRTRPIMQLLWQGIAGYISKYNLGLMFGCASLHGTDIDALATQLSYLYHYHLTPSEICPRALDERFVDMNIIPKDKLNPKRAFAALPPLIKGYIRVGATIGNGAVIDEQFNTTDICIVVQSSHVPERYRKHYERKNQIAMPKGHGEQTLKTAIKGSA